MRTQLEELKKYGYEIYVSNKYAWAYIITPSSNILYIEENHFYGYDVSFEYIPFNGCGSGCSCKGKGQDRIDPTIITIDLESIQKAERNGSNFAWELGAKRYKSVAQWFDRMWCKEDFYKL